ncbi:glutathione S-transferase [Rhizobium sp. Root1204]|uniref:glutathione S-transferase n=1 Tax=Rhizobium sp. Root1204 TaxID=1736428 RepID=UPI00071329D4|nr:glutathione S-transferase [Rhizobium sp. Root1204]KQV37009.1 glutathione S-transferase [Rhizobium sp. Root1204]
MKLLYSPISPYSTKVRIAAHYAGFLAEAVLTDPTVNPAELVENNPLGKIPTLITDDGQAVFDSRTIMRFIDRETKGKLYPRNLEKCREAEILEAICDGVCDCLLAIVYEKRFHPPEKVHQPWIEKQWEKVTRALDHLEAGLPRIGKKLHAGHFALAAMLRYIEFRFEGEWQHKRPKLKRWPDKFENAFPDYALFKA